jgi:hypothetical protein
VLGFGASGGALNVPRLLDRFLEAAGSRRCVRRGESGGPTRACAERELWCREVENIANTKGLGVLLRMAPKKLRAGDVREGGVDEEEGE